MKLKFVVVDHEGNISMGTADKHDVEPESFTNFAAAEKRAVELAECDPGKTVGIYELLAETIVPIGAPMTTKRKYPAKRGE